MNPAYAERDLNVGFSGGEEKEGRDLTAPDAEAFTCNS